MVVTEGVTEAVEFMAPRILFHVTPLSIEYCHWYEIPIPVERPVALKLTLALAQPEADEINDVPAFGTPEHGGGTT